MQIVIIEKIYIYRNQSIDLLGKSMDWFLYDNGLRHERVNRTHLPFFQSMYVKIYTIFFLSLGS